MKIYELTTLEIKVFSNAKIYAALQEHLPQAGGTLLGAFAADIGDLSRVMLLREFADANAAADAKQALLVQADPLGCGEWLVSLKSESFALFPFLDAPKPATLGKWYELRTYSLRHGKLAETIDAWKDALPARHAMSPCAGVFTALDGDQPRFLNLWAYNSVDERAKIRADAVAQGVWPPKGGPANLTKMHSDLCVALPFSPMK
jgi:NIPSNAP